MSIVPTSELISEAMRSATAVFAFNVVGLEHARAICVGAEEAGRPAILQLSQNTIAFHGDPVPIVAAMTALADASPAHLALHLDHIEDHALLSRAVELGFSSAMFDAGHLAYDTNVRATAEAAVWAHENGLWLEAELGYIGGKPDQPMSAHAEGVRTDPQEAAGFVAATGVDALAVAVGNAHAMTTRDAHLDIERIKRIAACLPIPIVLHGTSGVPDAAISAAITAGMRKINVGTALNMAYTAQISAHLAQSTSSDPRRYLVKAREAMTATVAHFLGLDGALA